MSPEYGYYLKVKRKTAAQAERLAGKIASLAGAEVRITELFSPKDPQSLSSGEILRMLREQTGLSIYRFSVRGGISNVTVSKLEKGTGVAAVSKLSLCGIQRALESVGYEPADPRVQLYFDLVAKEKEAFKSLQDQGLSEVIAPKNPIDIS